MMLEDQERSDLVRRLNTVLPAGIEVGLGGIPSALFYSRWQGNFLDSCDEVRERYLAASPNDEVLRDRSLALLKCVGWMQ